jgi:hypothetical protein
VEIQETANLDALLVRGTLDQTMHIDARRVNILGAERACLDNFLHLSNGNLRGCGNWRIEVASGAPEAMSDVAVT